MCRGLLSELDQHAVVHFIEAAEGIILSQRDRLIAGIGQNAGCKLARAAEALDMLVIGTRSASSRPELEALLRAADVISLHCPLSGVTRNLVG